MDNGSGQRPENGSGQYSESGSNQRPESGSGLNRSQPASQSSSSFFQPRPPLGRGFDAYTRHPDERPPEQTGMQPQVGVSEHAYRVPPSRTSRLREVADASPKALPTPQKAPWWRVDKRFSGKHSSAASPADTAPQKNGQWNEQWNNPSFSSPEGIPTIPVDPTLQQPAPSRSIWTRQPYSTGIHALALGGTCAFAWLLGVLGAQVLPGRFEQPPLQEVVLRRMSRVGQSLWPPAQLWQSPQQETRIEAIPLPTVGPITTSVELTPTERQPLIDELTSIETDIVSLERRLLALERNLGSPPYEDAGVNQRVATLRATLDPPVRAEEDIPIYEPTPADPAAALLEVADFKMTLPSDVLFAPGSSELKADPVLERVLDLLVDYPAATIVVRSYSDDQASAIASREFTLAQADTLARHLQSALPVRHRWVTLGGGLSQPLADNDSPVNRQRNRRIEILVDVR